MAETIVALGGQEYTIRRMPVGRVLKWRKEANKVVSALPPLVEQYQGDHEEWQLVKAAGALFGAADGVVEGMLECVLSASAELEADREHILEHAFEDEIWEAFQAALLLNAPLAGAESLITVSPGVTSESPVTT